MSAEKKVQFHHSAWFEWFMVGLYCVLGWLFWRILEHPTIGPGAENAHYIELAKSIVSGNGFSLVHTENPLPYLNTQPLYPLMLAGIISISKKTDLIHLLKPFKELNLAFYLLSIVMVHVFARRHMRKPYPFIVTGLYALAPLTVLVAGSITSDMAYIVFSLTALLMIDKYFRKGLLVTRGQLMGCGFWVLCGILTRNIGFSLLISFFIVALQRIGMKRSFIMLGIVLTLLSPWYLREIYFRNLYHQSETTVDQQEQMPSPVKQTGQYFSEVIANGKDTLTDTTQETLGSIDFERFDSLLVRKLHLEDVRFQFSDYPWVYGSLAVLIALGIVVGLANGSGIGSLYTLVYLLLCCLLPVERDRYLLPVLPFLLFNLYLGVMRLGEWMQRLYLPVSKIVVPILTVLIIFNSLGGHLENLRGETSEDAYVAAAVADPTVGLSGSQPEQMKLSAEEQQKAYIRAYRWINANTPDDAQLVSQQPSNTYIYTERKVRPFSLIKFKPNLVIQDLQKSDYVFEEKNLTFVKNRISPILEKNPDFFRLVYNDPASQIRIWQVLHKEMVGPPVSLATQR